MFFSLTHRKRQVCAILAMVLTVQPVFALQAPAMAQEAIAAAASAPVKKTEYRIPLRDLRVTDWVDPSGGGASPIGGAGNGVVNPGEDPEAPVLQFQPSLLEFDISGGYRDLRQTILTNTSKGPATLSGLVGNSLFMLSHTCPSTLAAGDSCVVTVKPAETTVLGDQASVAVTAPGIERPGSLSLSIVEKEKSPRLALSESIVNLGEGLRPGETVTGGATVTNLGPAPAVLNALKATTPGYTVTSDCPATLPIGASCEISASFSSYVAQAHNQSLTLAKDATGDTVLTFSAKVAKAPELLPALEFDVSQLQFDELEVGATATKQSVLTNRGSAPAELAPLRSDSNFAVTSDCPKTLSIDAACTVTLVFKPTKGGTSPSFTLVAAAQNDVTTELQVSGLGKAGPSDPVANLAFDPPGLVFGDVGVQQSSKLEAILTNSGAVAANIKSIVMKEGAKDFTQTNDCGATLAPGASCTITATFTPIGTDKRSGLVLVTLVDETSLGLTLGGTGQAAVLSSGADLVDLGAVQLPGTTQVKLVGIGNTGNVPLTGFGVVMSDDRLHVDLNDCGDVIMPKKGCSLKVSYSPDADGPISSGFQVVSSNGGTADKTVTGVGVALSAAPASLLFPETPQRVSAADQYVTLTNNGRTTVALDKIEVVAGIKQYGQSNNCGSSIAAGAACTIAVRYTPDAAGMHNGSIGVRVKSAATSTTAFSIPLSGKAQDAFLVATSSVNFQGIPLPGSSRTKAVTLTNKGVGPVAGLAVRNNDGRISINTNDCTDSLQAGKSCTLLVSFAPTVDGAFKSGFRVTTDNAGEQAISVEGVAVNLSASTGKLMFPDTQKGTPAPDQSFTLTNQGQAPITVDGIDIAGGSYDYGQSNNCGGALAPGGSCTVAIRFRPYALGERPGSWVVTVAGSPVVQVALSGNGVNHYLTVPKTFSAGSAPVGVTGLVKSFDIKNETGSSATVTGVSIVEGVAEFAQSNSCEQPVAPGASCTVSIQMTPSAVGELHGSLAITTSKGDYVVALTGAGVEPPPPVTTRYSIKFLNTEVGQSSAVRAIEYRNDGDAPLTVLGISQLDGQADFNQSNNCGEMLSPGETCTISAVFTPSKLGHLKGTVAIYADSGTSYLDLTGKGIGAEAVWLSSLGSYGITLTQGDFGVTAVGTVKKKTFYLKNNGSVTATQIATSLGGAGVTLDANTCGTAGMPIQLTAGGTCSVSVTWAPSTAGNLTDVALTVTGGIINGPSVLPLVGQAPAPGMAFLDTPGGDFGLMSSGVASAAKTFTLKNTGKFTDTLTVLDVTGTGFTKTGGTCKVGSALSASGTCTVIVTAQGATAGDMAGSINVVASSRAAAQQDMWGVVVQPAYAVSGAPGANTAAPANFGDVPVAYETAYGEKTGYFYLRDDSNAATVVLKSSTITGSGDFTVTSVQVFDYSNVYKGACASTTSGTTVACSTATPSRVVRIAVRFKPTAAGPKSALLHLEHNGEGGTFDIPLTGGGLQDSKGLWATGTASPNVPLASKTVDFGTRTAYGNFRIVYLVNVGSVGALSAGFKVSGDVSAFSIASKIAQDNYSGNLDARYGSACLTREGYTSTAESIAPCTASEKSKGHEKHLMLRMNFVAPLNAPGVYSVTLTPFSTNGSTATESITLTGVVK